MTTPVIAPELDPFHRYVADPLERAGATFVQQFVVLLLATGSAGLLGAQQWGKAADVAAFAAAISLLTSVLTFGVAKQSVGVDLAWRVVKTFVQSLLAVLIAAQLTPGIVHANWPAALAAAIPVAVFALLKGLAALAAPWSEGAGLLPLPGLGYAAPADADERLYTEEEVPAYPEGFGPPVPGAPESRIVTGDQQDPSPQG